MKWSVLSQPIFKGGLGLGYLAKRNRGSLGKWLWRFLWKLTLFGIWSLKVSMACVKMGLI